MIQRKTFYKIVSIIIALALVIILLSKVSIHDVIDTLFSIDPLYLIAGFFLYSCTYLLRALRFSILLNKTISFRNIFSIVCIHNMMTNILPSRSGELSYVYLLKKIHARTTGEGVATLVVARIFDLIVLIFLFIIAGFFIQDIPQIFQDILWIIYLFLFSLVGILMAMIFSGRSCMQFLKKIMAWFQLEEKKYGIYILRKGNEVIDSLDRINMRKNVFSIGVISCLIWVFSYTSFYLILLGIDITLPIQNIIFGAVLILLVGILPTPGIAGFGTGQAVFAIVYIPLGMTVDGAIISGFCWHIVVILFTIVLGSLGSFLLKSAS